MEYCLLVVISNSRAKKLRKGSKRVASLRANREEREEETVDHSAL